MTTLERIAKTYLVPVAVIDDAKNALNAARALLIGGVDIMEITLRTEAGLPSIESVRRDCPEVLAGAGTVLSVKQCEAAIAAGAEFVVSPGFDADIVRLCLDKGIAPLPGCVTPSEIMAARKLGLSVLKFFPANIYGGIKAIKALAGPFPDIKFVPTGGVDISNLADYVDKAVFAIGGGWLFDRKAVQKGDFDALTKAARDSLSILRQIDK